MIGIIYKKDYSNRIKIQLEVFNNMKTALESIKEVLPENGKRFDKRFFDKINTSLKDSLSLVLRPYTSYSNVGLALYYVGYENVDTKSLEMIHYYDYGKPNKPILYENGIMKDRDEIIKMINTYLISLEKNIGYYENALNNVSEFIEKWNEFYDCYQALYAMKNPIVDIPYVPKCPIVEE